MKSDMQIGKAGVTDNFIETLKKHFVNREHIRISVLRSARGDGKEGRDVVKKISEEILNKLGKNYTSRIIGFVIAVRKWRKAR